MSGRPSPTAKVHVASDDEWLQIVLALIQYNTFSTVDLEEAFTVVGKPVLNGAFGVPKGKLVPGTDGVS